jgi:electron-transferring-flavoprotein dehydrogenase
MKHYGLREGVSPQTYALGIKEVWEVPEEQHQPGLVIHTLGYPLTSTAYGGGFLYHMDNR